MMHLGHNNTKKFYGFTPNLDFNTVFTKFTKFLQSSMQQRGGGGGGGGGGACVCHAHVNW